MKKLEPTAPLRAAGQMKVSELLEQVIPRGEAERIAAIMGYTPDYVRRWRRDPEAGETSDSARRDPVTNLQLFFDALRARELGEWIPVIMDFLSSDLASRSKGNGRSGAISPAQAESELRAMAQRSTEIADMLAAGKGKR